MGDELIESPAMHTPTAAPQEAADLLEAAIQAANAGQDELSLQLLQRSVGIHHYNPMAHYLLGADCAQRQRYGDAVLHMTTALEQAPGLWIARLQLGLLWLTLANPNAARAVLLPCQELPLAEGLRLFADGLLALAADDLPLAANCLSSGLQVGTSNRALMGDMERLLHAIEDRRSQAVASVAADEVSVPHGVAISAYVNGGSGG